jgi:hypothetical protein
VSKTRRVLPRCSGVTSDRSQCGRRVADGSNPPLCHIHAAIARGQAANALTDTGDDFDEIKALKRLARSSNEQIKLRAIDLLLERKRKQKEQDVKDAPGPTARMFLDALLPEERELVRSLVRQLNEFKEVVYERVPKLRPPDWRPVDAAVVVPAPQPIEEPAAPSRAEHTITAAPEDEDDDVLHL